MSKRLIIRPLGPPASGYLSSAWAQLTQGSGGPSRGGAVSRLVPGGRGRRSLSPAPGRDTHFGWEAVRLPWRLALDGLWFGNPGRPNFSRTNSCRFSSRSGRPRGRLAAVYNFDGAPAVDYESPVLYAGVLAAALAAGDRDFARQMALKILSFYHEDGRRAYFVSPDNYYANNWAWLGLALYAGWVEPGKRIDQAILRQFQ